MKEIKLKNFRISQKSPIVLIAGPCQIESLDHCLMIAERLQESCSKYNVPFIFKSSFDKANRTSHLSKRGVGLVEGLEILNKVKQQIECPLLTDIHTTTQCAEASEVVDILQIPAFLCRQTDLLLAAGKTQRIINVKKGQFLAPWEMKNISEKIETTNNHQILLTERGTSFGYNTLINDFRSLPIMAAQTNYPIIFDATHSVQQPGGKKDCSGGQREFAHILAKAAVAIGVAGVFFETHEDPDNAPSDGPNMTALKEMGKIIKYLKELDDFIKSSHLLI